MFPRFPSASGSPSHLEQNSPKLQSPTQRQAGSTTATTLAPLGLAPRSASTGPSAQPAGLLSCFQGVFNKRSKSATEFSQPRISLSEKTRDRARAEALAKPLKPVPDVRPIAQPKSLETIAGECGVPAAALEEHIKDELKSFCVKTATSSSRSPAEHRALMDKLYNLFLQSNEIQSPKWIRNTQDFDSFIAHFCPQANKNSRSILIYYINDFCRKYLPPMMQFTGDEVNPVYNGPRNWVKFPQALVDIQVAEEARQLVSEGFTGKEKLFVHGTGSAAMANLAKNQAIWSASLAIQSGDKVVTGEYTTYISSNDGQTSITGGTSGLTDIYTSRKGLSSDGYTMRRWFDETPVTFGINEEKQRAYNDARNIERWYNDAEKEEVTVGPIVPLENVVAISAPKASEARIRLWIAAHCPHAKFISYEAARILESDNLLGLLPELLVWPDGRHSSGSVTKSSGGYQFFIGGESSVAREGKKFSGKIGSDFQPLPAISTGNNKFIVDLPPASSIKIDPIRGDKKVLAKSIGKDIPSSPSSPNLFLSDVKIRRVRVSTFERIIRTATGATRGMSGKDLFIASQLFSKAVMAIADRARFPEKVKNVALALDDVKTLEFCMAPGGIEIFSSYNSNILPKLLSDMQIGHCSYFALQLVSLPEKNGHAVGIMLDKKEYKTYSVGIINSEGWNGESNHPVLAKTASEDDVIQGFNQLLLPCTPADRISAAKGKLIQDWLINSIARDQPTVKFIHGTSPVVQTPQKGFDCTIESTFALMVASLCQSDYKMAKASCLNALHDIAKSCIRERGSTLTQEDIELLSIRTTSALRGYAVESKMVRQPTHQRTGAIADAASDRRSA